MKEILKHRIDGLMEKATAGDADAQLQLAKEFVRGKYVEKSQDNAKYWAFKAVNGGNTSAEIFYNDLCSGRTKPKCSVKGILKKKILLVPILELILGLAVLIFAPGDNLLCTVSLYSFIAGLATLIFTGMFGKDSAGIVLIMTHIIALIIAII